MWTSTENQGNFLGRISIRRNQVTSAEGDIEDLEFFQKKIAERFSDLLPTSSATPRHKDHHHHSHQQHLHPLPPTSSPGPPQPSSDSATSADGSSSSSAVADSSGDGGADAGAAKEALLSIAWLRKLLDAFLCCEAEFKAVLLMGRDPSHIVKSPLDKLIPEMLERTVKALDVCNAITHGVEAIRHVQKQAEIVVSALDQRPFTDGQIRRAKKALSNVLTSIVIDEKEVNSNKTTERSWSFGRRSCSNNGIISAKDHHISNFRSLSWSVSKNWSAAKQIQAISSNLNAPRGGESTGLAMTIYIMSVVLAFIMWTLVAAIPCQERTGLGIHISVPKQPGWAHVMSGLQEKIAEEWKKKEKKGGGGSAGLMEEVVKVEKTAQGLMDCLAQFQFPMEDERELEVAGLVADLAETCKRMEDGLEPLRQQIREVFHRIVRSRAEVLDMLDQAAKGPGTNS